MALIASGVVAVLLAVLVPVSVVALTSGDPDADDDQDPSASSDTASSATDAPGPALLTKRSLVAPVDVDDSADGVNLDLYVVDPDGTSRVLVEEDGNQRFASISPDRRFLQYGSQAEDGTWTQWVLSQDLVAHEAVRPAAPEPPELPGPGRLVAQAGPDRVPLPEPRQGVVPDESVAGRVVHPEHRGLVDVVRSVGHRVPDPKSVEIAHPAVA